MKGVVVKGEPSPEAALLLDIDGTLVDTNYQHAIAWFRAFKDHGIVLPIWRIHRHIGMGGDKIVTALCGEEVEEAKGDRIRDSESEHYMAMIGEVDPLPHARSLIDLLVDRGHEVVLASSAKEKEVEHYVDLLEARDRVTAWTSSADVEETKPAPDLVESALAKVSAERAELIGDTPWDVKAAAKAGVPTVAVLTGGFSEQELSEAGAVAVYKSLGELIEARYTRSL